MYVCQGALCIPTAARSRFVIPPRERVVTVDASDVAHCSRALVVPSRREMLEEKYICSKTFCSRPTDANVYDGWHQSTAAASAAGRAGDIVVVFSRGCAQQSGDGLQLPCNGTAVSCKEEDTKEKGFFRPYSRLWLRAGRSS